jgi:hypothetical protein
VQHVNNEVNTNSFGLQFSSDNVPNEHLPEVHVCTFVPKPTKENEDFVKTRHVQQAQDAQNAKDAQETAKKKVANQRKLPNQAAKRNVRERPTRTTRQLGRCSSNWCNPIARFNTVQASTLCRWAIKLKDGGAPDGTSV